MKAKPFLKWAGGKTQLIDSIEKFIPKRFKKCPFTYVEPFVGSGALLFWILDNYKNIEKAVINDVNGDLINTYRVIDKFPNEIISVLLELQNQYHTLDEYRKKEYYYKKRELYNSRVSDKVLKAALFIFLNRTCFNGLYRVNSKNLYNVPIGSYKKPTICDAENILNVSSLLKRVEILEGDFEDTIDYATDNSLFYFDPPYKPLNQTSSFNSYTKDSFGDEEQKRLKAFCDLVTDKGCHFILSNADLMGKNIEDVFFDDLYSSYNIYRVKATRRINSHAEKRGELSELMITNHYK